MKTTLPALALLAGLSLSGTAQAALIDRGGGLIYDSTLDVTWLQDANYAMTSGYDPDGKLTWAQANAWVSGLSYNDAVRGVTYTDWRLPKVTDLGAPGPQQSVDGTDAGYNVDVRSSEFAHLYHVDLGNSSKYKTTLPFEVRDVFGLVDTGPFSNFGATAYWSGTENAKNTDQAWYFAVDNGFQTTVSKTAPYATYYALAVRDGDVAAIANVPEPQILALMLAGWGLIGWRAKRRG